MRLAFSITEGISIGEPKLPRLEIGSVILLEYCAAEEIVGSWLDIRVPVAIRSVTVGGSRIIFCDHFRTLFWKECDE